MFALIESCPERRPGFGWTGKLISLAMHAFVISAALALTQHAVAGVGHRPDPKVMIWDVPKRPAPQVMVNDPPPVAIPRTAVPQIVPPVEVPPEIPPPATVAVEPGSPAPGTPGTPGALPGLNPLAGLPGASDAPRDVRFVEELPVLLSHPPIRYPEVLRQAGIEGRVLIETVLDTLGRAEPGLTRVVRGASELFDREALGVVLASRYRAARVDGRAVRVRVEIPVNFSIRP